MIFRRQRDEDDDWDGGDVIAEAVATTAVELLYRFIRAAFIRQLERSNLAQLLMPLVGDGILGVRVAASLFLALGLTLAFLVLRRAVRWPFVWIPLGALPMIDSPLTPISPEGLSWLDSISKLPLKVCPATSNSIPSPDKRR